MPLPCTCTYTRPEPALGHQGLCRLAHVAFRPVPSSPNRGPVGIGGPRRHHDAILVGHGDYAGPGQLRRDLGLCWGRQQRRVGRRCRSSFKANAWGLYDVLGSRCLVSRLALGWAQRNTTSSQRTNDLVPIVLRKAGVAPRGFWVVLPFTACPTRRLRRRSCSRVLLMATLSRADLRRLHTAMSGSGARTPGRHLRRCSDRRLGVLS
jgi:hypothetical protein